MYKEVNKKQTILDLINGNIKESELERFNVVDFGQIDISPLGSIELSYLMSGFIEDNQCLLFEEVDN